MSRVPYFAPDLGASALYALPMRGQTANTGAIAGTVSDPDGALVAHAAIVVESQATQEERDLATNVEGTFWVPILHSRQL